MLKLFRSSFSNIKNGNLTSSMSRLPKRFCSLVLNDNLELAPLETKTNESDNPVEIPNPFEKEKRNCILCELNIIPEYKNYQLLSQFQSPYTGRIYGRHITGLCKRQQELVEREIRKAQICALMPVYHRDVEFVDDPKLFNPERPIRPHKY